MNASEAVYGVLGWLCTRSQHVLLGVCGNQTGVLELAKRFCTENSLPQLRTG